MFGVETGVGAMIVAETKVGNPGVNQVPPEYAAMAKAIKEEHAAEDSSGAAGWKWLSVFIVFLFVIQVLPDGWVFSLAPAERLLAYAVIISFAYYHKFKEPRPKAREWILSTLITIVGFYLAFFKVPPAVQQWMPFSVAQGLALWVYFVTWKVKDGTRQDFLRKDFWKWVGKSFLFASAIAATFALILWAGAGT